jgi:hypothetical protein
VVELEMAKENISKKDWYELVDQTGEMRAEVLDVVSKQTALAKSIKIQDKNIRQILQIVKNLDKGEKVEDNSGNESDQTNKTTQTGRTARNSARINLTLKDCEDKANNIAGFVAETLVIFQDLQEIQYKYFLNQ